MQKKFTVEEVDAFIRQLKLLIGGIVVVIVLPLIVYTVYLDRRLEEFEDNLRFSPPHELDVSDVSSRELPHFMANPVEGEIVYVPAYSHVYHSGGKPLLLTITLSVRNTSIESEIVINSVRYFDTKGKEVRSYLDKPVRLPSLGTTEIVVEREDASGGSGANFLVEWYATRPVTAPIIETVMIDTNIEQGISFARRGAVVSQTLPKR